MWINNAGRIEVFSTNISPFKCMAIQQTHLTKYLLGIRQALYYHIIIIGYHPQNKVWKSTDGIPRDHERSLLVGDTEDRSRPRCNLFTSFVELIFFFQVFVLLKEALSLKKTLFPFHYNSYQFFLAILSSYYVTKL